MIVFAAIVPHPPMSIPGIGTEKNFQQFRKTLESFENLRIGLEVARPDVIVVISPHAHMEEYRFVINSAPRLVGSFERYGLQETMDFNNDIEIVDKLAYVCQVNEFPCHLHPSFLDHGTLVPLHHLTKNIRPNVVQLSFSLMSYQQHYRYGEMMGNFFESNGMDKRRIAIIASGDLSHRLSEIAPMGFSPSARNFDHELIRHLANKDISEIVGLHPETVSEAAECGVRSILILLGALHDKDYKFELLGYEAPYGVGHLSARLL